MTYSKGIAVDIGTSTIGMALVEQTTGAILAQYGCRNSQKKHGADVAARIRYGSTIEGAKEMSRLVKEDLLTGFRQLSKEWYTVKTIVISANTTMEYLLLGRITKAFGEYPFLMEDSGWREYPIKELFQEGLKEQEQTCEATVLFLPCISTFVGGDLTSGLYYLQFPKQRDCEILLDLGTNGEMAISGENGFYATSVAAGPAFEASMRGQGRKGTALTQWIARARCRNQLTKEGTIAKRYEETGIVLEDQLVLTQDILRKIQLAKGALLAGMELLLKQYGTTASEVKRVYIAGNFGFHLDVQSAVLIGMIPANFQGKVEVVGNSSLKGAIQCLLDTKAQEKMQHITKQVIGINLAEEKDFQTAFLQRMSFERIRL